MNENNTQLAVPQPATAPQHTLQEIVQMANIFAESKLFGLQTVEQAAAVCLKAQAEGRHPASAANDYHVLDTKGGIKLTLKAEVMLARFQLAGGTVKWLEHTDAKVTGEFYHPSGGTLIVTWDNARVQQAGLGGGTHSKYPRQMKMWRVAAEAIRALFPAVLGGVYSDWEVRDFDLPAQPAPAQSDYQEVEAKPEVLPPPANKPAAKRKLKVDRKTRSGEPVATTEPTPAPEQNGDSAKQAEAAIAGTVEPPASNAPLQTSNDQYASMLYHHRRCSGLDDFQATHLNLVEGCARIFRDKKIPSTDPRAMPASMADSWIADYKSRPTHSSFAGDDPNDPQVGVPFQYTQAQAWCAANLKGGV